MRTLLTLFLVAIPLFSFGQTRFNRIYNYDQHYQSYGTLSQIFGVALNKNDFIVTGMAYDDSETAYRTTFIAGMDYNGNWLWQKNLDFTRYYNFFSSPTAVITSIDSNRFVVTGSGVSPFARANMINFFQPFIHIFSKNGDSLHFNELYDTLESRQFQSVCVTSDKKILAAGKTFLTTAYYDGVNPDLIPDSSAIYLVKFDTTGQKIWERRLFRNKRSTAIDSVTKDPAVWNLLPTPDGGAIMSVFAYTPNWFRPSSCLMKLDSSGNVQWTKLYVANTNVSYPLLDICTARGGGYYFLTDMATRPPLSGNQSYYNSILVYGRLNDNGDTIWTKHFALPGEWDGYTWTEGGKIKQDNNGRLLILGFAADTVTWNSTLIRADSNGNIISYRQYDYKDYEPFSQNLWTLDITPQNNILMTGYIQNELPVFFDTLGYYGWLVQTDSLGCLVPGCQAGDTVWQQLAVKKTSPVSGTYMLYPNPAKEYCMIKSDSKTDGTVRLTDASGRLLLERNLSPFGTTRIDLTDLPSGIYFVMVLDDSHAVTAFKVAKE